MATVYRVLCGVVLALCVGAGPAIGAGHTLLVVSDGSPAYQQTVARIRQRLSTAQPALQVEVSTLDAADDARINAAEIVVTIGTQAALNVVKHHRGTRLICALLTQQTYQRLPPPPPGAQRSAVFLDQPPRRQLALIETALPHLTRVAIVHSASSRDHVDQIVDAARSSALSLEVAEVADAHPLYEALRTTLNQPAVLLAIPDTTVFNNFTIQNVLLTAYRKRAPVVGFSPAYVRAGAVMAVYSTPDQVGDQVAGVILAAAAGEDLPPPAYPRDFLVSTNPHVARSMSIELPPPTALAAALKQREGAPR